MKIIHGIFNIFQLLNGIEYWQDQYIWKFSFFDPIFFVFYVIISSHTFKILNSHFSQYSREKIFYQNISNYWITLSPHDFDKSFQLLIHHRHFVFIPNYSNQVKYLSIFE